MKLFFALFLASTATICQAGDLWPWASQNAKNPPKVQPYEIPTLHGKPSDFKTPAPDWVKAPRISGDEVFAMVIACYPSRSRWRIDVDLLGAVRNTAAIDVTGTTIGRSMVGIVAKMPIYSDTEMDREREREYRRRTDTAQIVAEFVGSIAKRNQAARMLALSAAMERRAQIRVNEGITDATEQTGWLEKTAQAEQTLIEAESKTAESRLKLVVMCRDEVADGVNSYLTELAQLPEKARP